MRVRRVQNARMQHIWLLKLSRGDRRTCHKWTCIYPALLLSHHMGASYLACVLMFCVGNITSTGFIVFVIHKLMYQAAVVFCTKGFSSNKLSKSFIFSKILSLCLSGPSIRTCENHTMLVV